MIDVESQFSALKAAWIARIISNKVEHWKELPLKFINRLGEDFYILKTNIDNTDKCSVIKSLPLFYQEAIVSFTKAKVIDNNLPILSQVLFGNQNIASLRRGKVVIPYFINWIQSGIKNVSDLHIVNGKVNEYFILNKVINKTNIYSEILCIKRCLAVYKDVLGDNYPQDQQPFPLFMVNNKEVEDIHTKGSKIGRASCRERV